MFHEWGNKILRMYKLLTTLEGHTWSDWIKLKMCIILNNIGHQGAIKLTRGILLWTTKIRQARGGHKSCSINI